MRRSSQLVGATVAVAVAVAVLVAGCSAVGGAGPSGSVSVSGVPSASGAPRTLTVFAAASLRNAFAALAPVYEAAHPGIRLVFSYDASSALRAQIEQGAPVDVFASADTRNPEALAAAGLTTGQPTPFAGNRLTVIVPTGNPAGIRSPADLARPGIRVVAAGPDVPITRYADKAIANLAALSGYPPDFTSRVAANIVSHEDNVRAVVAKIELGEGDAAIVYVTDAQASTKVVPVAIPDAANVSATYAAVAVKGSADASAAASFVAWLAGPDAATILARFGFSAPR